MISSARENPRNAFFLIRVTVPADVVDSSRFVAFVTEDTLQRALLYKLNSYRAKELMI